MTNLLKTLQAKITKNVIVVKESQKQYFAYREVYRQLSNMTDRDLRDIGISRGDIETIARQSALV